MSFATPTVALIINGDNNDTDNITITSVDADAPFNVPLTIDGKGGTDTVNLNAALNLSVGAGTLSVTAEAINVAAVTIQTSGNQSYSGPLSVSGSTLNPGSTFVVLGGNVNVIGSALSTIQGKLDLGGVTRTFTVADVTSSVATDLTIPAVISNGGLTKLGPGTLSLGGANSYSGDTTVSAGTLVLGASDVIADASAISVTGGTLDFNGNSDTIASLNQTGDTVTLGSGTIVVTGNFTSGATVNASTGTLKVGGDLDLGSAIFTPGTSTVELTKASVTQTLKSSSAGFHHLTHSGAGTVQVISSFVNVGGTLLNSAGTFDANGIAVTVTGLTTVSGGELSRQIGHADAQWRTHDQRRHVHGSGWHGGRDQCGAQQRYADRTQRQLLGVRRLDEERRHIHPRQQYRHLRRGDTTSDQRRCRFPSRQPQCRRHDHVARRIFRSWHADKFRRHLRCQWQGCDGHRADDSFRR